MSSVLAAAVPVLGEDATVASIAVAIVAVIAVVVLLLLLARRGGAAHAVVSAAAAAAGIKTRKPRTIAAALIGVPGAGKTALFLRLIGQTFRETNMSMNANRSHLFGHQGVTIVDVPGTRRKRNELLLTVDESKKLIVVMDSITIQDDRDEGANAIADLLCDVMNAPAADGLKSVLFVCTKRDDMTSFSSKAIRKVLEVAIARELSTRQAGVGSLNMVAGVKSLKRGTAAAATSGGSTASSSSHEEESSSAFGLFLREDGKFSFDDLPIPFAFVDVSSKDSKTMEEVDAAKFSVQQVQEFILN